MFFTHFFSQVLIRLQGGIKKDFLHLLVTLLIVLVEVGLGNKKNGI